jgi:hypothetical protein
MERSEGNMSLKNPVTPPGIDPGTVRLIAQRLNHHATPGPTTYSTDSDFKKSKILLPLCNSSFLGTFAKLQKATISLVMFVRLSIRMHQLGYIGTYFHEIW